MMVRRIKYIIRMSFSKKNGQLYRQVHTYLHTYVQTETCVNTYVYWLKRTWSKRCFSVCNVMEVPGIVLVIISYY